jgi:hypothetical protein
MLGVRYVIFYQRLRAAFEVSEVGSGKVGSILHQGVLDMELGMHAGGVVRSFTAEHAGPRSGACMC